MPGQPVKIGPFVGGVNTYSGPSAIQDNEAVEILNMDVDLDGSLVGRPGIFSYTTAPKTGRSHILGTYRSKTDDVYIIYAFEAGGIYAMHSVTRAWTTIQSTGSYSDVVQYNDKLWIVQYPSGILQGGGSWDPVGGYSAIAAMPRGYSACIYKERMFIAASVNSDTTSINRMKFSNPSNPGAWTSTDTLDVAAGDGQDILSLYVYDNSIVIFKSDSTYIFAYESQPTKGQVQIVSSTIGVNNNFCVVEYENSMFVMHESRVYRIANWNWELANVKIPFVYRNTNSSSVPDGSSVSVIGNRIVCRYYDNYYVLGTKTGAWVTWEFADGDTIFPTDFTRSPNVDPVAGAESYYASNHDNTGTFIFKFVDSSDADARDEVFDVRLSTKVYDYGVPYGFKRLYWWGVDLLAKNPIDYLVTPVVYGVPVTWGQIAAVPFSGYITWGMPLNISINVTDSSNNSNPTNFRTFIKLLKGLRFRQVQFTLETTSDGTTATGPLRIFSLTSFVDNKEIVSKKVS